MGITLLNWRDTLRWAAQGAMTSLVFGTLSFFLALPKLVMLTMPPLNLLLIVPLVLLLVGLAIIHHRAQRLELRDNAIRIGAICVGVPFGGLGTVALLYVLNSLG